MKCHQRIIREQKAAVGHTENLFGAWWSGIDTDIKKASLRKVDLRTAASIITEYEYLGTMPNAPMLAYGIFWAGALGGVVVFGAVSPPNVARSVIQNPFSEKVIQLARGACTHWAHPHSASKLIAYSLKQVQREGWKVVIAFSDPDAGEIGTVYQASNWLYCGLSADRPDYILPDGSRSVGHIKAGVASTLKKVKRTRKGRYVFLLGTHTEKKALRKCLLWTVEQYPKRDALEVSREIRSDSIREGAVRFRDNAPL